MRDKKDKSEERIEQTLMRELRFGGIEKENLEELVGIVAKIHKSGLRRFKVFPKGMPPIIDGVQISGVIDAGEINKIIGEILLNTPRLREIGCFPLGTPWPDIFRVNIDIGATIENSASNRF